jgi:hypothetical protein
MPETSKHFCLSIPKILKTPKETVSCLLLENHPSYFIEGFCIRQESQKTTHKKHFLRYKLCLSAMGFKIFCF